MNIFRVVGSSLALSAAATIFGAQGLSDENKSSPPAASQRADDKSHIEKLIADLDSAVYRKRDVATSKLITMASNLEVLVYILNARAKSDSLEVTRRLELAQKKAIETLMQTAASQAGSPEKNKTLMILIESMKNNRSPGIWKALLPISANLITQEATLNGRYNVSHYGQHGELQLDTQMVELLSNLLASIKNDTKELQDTALSQAITWIKPPFQQLGPFQALHEIKLKELTELPEDKIESGLKNLKTLYFQLNFSSSYGLEAKVAQSAKPHLEKILERCIQALSTGDADKQKTAIATISVLKEQFDSPKVADILSSQNGALIFGRRLPLTLMSAKRDGEGLPPSTKKLGEGLSTAVTSAKKLQELIKVPQSISDLTRNDSDYHRSYVNWLKQVVDNTTLQQTPEKTEMLSILESALREELYTIAKNGNRTPLQAELILPLVKTYTKLVQQSNLNPNSLREQIRTIIDFQYSSQFCLNLAAKERLHPHLLTLFDTVTENINGIQKAEDKTSLRIGILTAVPRAISYSPQNIKNAEEAKRTEMQAANRLLDLQCKDYLGRLSGLYFKGQGNLDTQEFVNLTRSLISLDTQWGQWTEGTLPAEMMLQFIRKDFDQFEKNIKQIVKNYNDSNNPDIKASLKEQLVRVNSSFQLLFSEGEKVSNGWIGQARYQTKVIENNFTGVGDWAQVGWVHLDSRPDLKAQILEIKNLFNQRLERQISEIIFPKVPAKMGSML